MLCAGRLIAGRCSALVGASVDADVHCRCSRIGCAQYCCAQHCCSHAAALSPAARLRLRAVRPGDIGREQLSEAVIGYSDIEHAKVSTAHLDALPQAALLHVCMPASAGCAALALRCRVLVLSGANPPAPSAGEALLRPKSLPSV